MGFVDDCADVSIGTAFYGPQHEQIAKGKDNRCPVPTLLLVLLRWE